MAVRFAETLQETLVEILIPNTPDEIGCRLLVGLSILLVGL